MTPPPRVAYQGERGAYGEDAVLAYWGADARPLPARTFADALEQVLAGAADGAVLPVWNSTVGTVEAATAALRARTTRLAVAAELLVPVRHCLLALPGASLHEVRHVASHPVALAQCTRLLAAHPAIAAHDAYDTAGAARELAELGRAPAVSGADTGAHGASPWYRALHGAAPLQLAVIASRRAAACHGLAVLLADVQDEPANATRFAVVRAVEGARW